MPVSIKNSKLRVLFIATLIGVIIIQIHFLALSNEKLRTVFGDSIVVTGTVASDPQLTRERVSGSKYYKPRTSFLMRLQSVAHGNVETKFRLPVRVILDETSRVRIHAGMEISLSGRLSETKEQRVSAIFYGRAESIQIVDEPALMQSLEKVRIALREAATKLGTDSAALIPGLVVGDTSLQSTRLSENMRQAGLNHLTAVSGANFAIVGTFVFSALAFLFPSRRPRIVITSIALFFFVLLVRPTPSVLRASIMTGSYLLARFLGLENQAKNSLASAVLLLLLINPLQAFEPGFILSVLATSGLIYLAPSISQKLIGPTPIRELVAIPVAATLACSPYLMFLSGSINLGTIAMNVLVAPVVGVITISGFLAMLLSLPLPNLASLFIYLADFGCRWIVSIAKLNGNFPTLSGAPWILILIAATVAISMKTIRKQALLIAFFLLILTSYSTFPGKDWEIGQCDVGQGDALLVRVAKHEAVLFDAGPDPKLLKECLSEFGIRKLPLVILSHQHADHFNGITGIDSRKVGEIWVNHDFPDLADFRRNMKVVSTGYRARVGDVNLEVIWPARGDEIFETITGDGSLENNRSLVIKVELEGVGLLVTGDIEPGAQREILKRNDLNDISILKVPHHGSKYQEMELFRRSDVFLISVGANNYGHPNPELISELESLGAVERTDKSGAIALEWNEREPKPVFSVRRLGKEWWRLNWHWLQ